MHLGILDSSVLLFGGGMGVILLKKREEEGLEKLILRITEWSFQNMYECKNSEITGMP